MADRPRTAPLLFGALTIGIGLGSFLVELGAIAWPLVGGIVLLVVGVAALAGVLGRDRNQA